MKIRRIKHFLVRVRTDPRPNWHDGRTMYGMQWYFPERGIWKAWAVYLRRTSRNRTCPKKTDTPPSFTASAS